MERPLRVALTVAGVVGAVAWMGLAGRRTPPTEQIEGVVADIDMAVRETSAGTQARAVTLAQLPRLAWAVVTDEATVRDLTTEELAFRPQPSEQIEIAQIEGEGGRVRRLIGIPAHGASALVVPKPGLHLVVTGDDVRVTAVVRIEPVQRGKIVAGLVAVAQRVDTSRTAAILGGKGIGARLQTPTGSVVISGVPARGSTRTVEMMLRSPAAEGAKLVLSVPVGIAWGHVAGAVILLFASVVLGKIFGRRPDRAGFPQPSPGPPPFHEARFHEAPIHEVPVHEVPVHEAPFHEASAHEASVHEASVHGALVHEAAPREAPADPQEVGLFEGEDPTVVGPPSSPSGTSNGHASTPKRIPAPLAARNGHVTHAPPSPGGSGAHLSESGAHGPQSGAQPIKTRSLEMSGVVFAHGISTTMPSALFTDAPGRESRSAAPRPADEPFETEYRALFKEFVKLRRTCGESTGDLDRDRFMEVLQRKRVELIARHGVTEVKFRLAFDNGRAAVRFKIVT